MNIPKLRFPEFNDEWKKEKFSQFSYNSGKKNKDNLELVPYAITNTLGFVPQNEAHNEFGYMKDTDRKAYNIVTKNSFAYNPARINVGSIGYYSDNDDIIVSSLYEVFKTKDYINDKFIWYWLKSCKFPKWIIKLQEGSVRQYFYYDKLCETQVYLPSYNEQKMIANTLELLDKKIELQSKKIEDLKLYKKGLINILNNYSFKETTLGEIGYFQSSSIDKLIRENEKIVNLYNYMDVYKHKIIMSKDLQQLSKTSAKESQIITNCLNRGDILFTPSSETPDDIGHSICIQENLINTVYSYHLLRFRPNIEMNLLFSNYYFNNSKIRNQIIKYATGATRYTVSLDCFSKIKIKIPDSITQKKYGKLLYNADIKINIESRKLDKLIGLKKGLMQNMFV